MELGCTYVINHLHYPAALCTSMRTFGRRIPPRLRKWPATAADCTATHLNSPWESASGIDRVSNESASDSDFRPGAPSLSAKGWTPWGTGSGAFSKLALRAVAAATADPPVAVGTFDGGLGIEFPVVAVLLELNPPFICMNCVTCNFPSNLPCRPHSCWK